MIDVDIKIKAIRLLSGRCCKGVLNVTDFADGWCIVHAMMPCEYVAFEPIFHLELNLF